MGTKKESQGSNDYRGSGHESLDENNLASSRGDENSRSSSASSHGSGSQTSRDLYDALNGRTENMDKIIAETQKSLYDNLSSE